MCMECVPCFWMVSICQMIQSCFQFCHFIVLFHLLGWQCCPCCSCFGGKYFDWKVRPWENDVENLAYVDITTSFHVSLHFLTFFIDCLSVHVTTWMTEGKELRGFLCSLNLYYIFIRYFDSSQAFHTSNLSS